MINLGMVAGEASGDILGAGLIQALQQEYFRFTAHGIGGSRMLQAGFTNLYPMDRLSVMGLVEPLKRLPELLRIRRDLFHYFKKLAPAAFIGIDSPDFNLGLEYKLRCQGIKTIHYVSPSVWAWRRGRIHKIAKACDLVLTLFPFEADFYHQHQVPVKFVGHPLADLIPLYPNRLAARQQLNLDPEATYVALLPGSRRHELHYHGELFIAAAARLAKARSNLRFITSAINAERDQAFKAAWQRVAPTLKIEFYQEQAHTVMAAANAVLVTSGTATLETMLYKRPMVIAYRMSPFTYQIAKHLVKIPYIGLPNLLAKKALVPEFIQNQATPEALSDALLDFLNYPEKALALEQEFLKIHYTLRRNANQTAATAVRELLQVPSS